MLHFFYKSKLLSMMKKHFVVVSVITDIHLKFFLAAYPLVTRL